MVLIDKIKAIGDAIRNRTGITDLMTLDEMAETIEHMESGPTTYDAYTYIIVDENGNEVPAVLTEEEVVLTATAAHDIRIGTTAVTDEGVVTGEKEIPSYYISVGYKIITNGSKFVVSIPDYEYTKLQAIFCPYNVSITKSVVAEKVAIENNVYPVRSAISEAVIVKDTSGSRIDFGITNTSGSAYVIRYFSYKEIN